MPGRRYAEFASLLGDFQPLCTQTSTEMFGEIAWNGLRLVVAHDPVTALEQQAKRKAKMVELEDLAKGWAGKLDGQDQGAKKKGRKLSDSGTKAPRVRHQSDVRKHKIITWTFIRHDIDLVNGLRRIDFRTTSGS